MIGNSGDLYPQQEACVWVLPKPLSLSARPGQALGHGSTLPAAAELALFQFICWQPAKLRHLRQCLLTCPEFVPLHLLLLHRGVILLTLGGAVLPGQTAVQGVVKTQKELKVTADHTSLQRVQPGLQYYGLAGNALCLDG